MGDLHHATSRRIRSQVPQAQGAAAKPSSRSTADDHYLGPHGTKASQIEYDRLITEWLSSGRSPSYGAPEQHDLDRRACCSPICDYARAYYGDGPRGELCQHEARAQAASRALRPRAGHEFRTASPQGHSAEVYRRRLCRSNINGRVQRIGRVFRWAVAEGLMPPEVPQSLAMVPGLRRGHTEAPEGQKVRPADEAIVAATLAHLSPVVRAMVELQQFTGMRPGELVILRPCDIDRTATFGSTNRKSTRTRIATKSGSSISAPRHRTCFARSCCARPTRIASPRPKRWPGTVPSAMLSERRQPVAGIGLARIGRANPKWQQAIGTHRKATTMRFAAPAIGRSRSRRKSPTIPHAVAEWHTRHRWAPNRLRHSLATKVRRDFDIDAAKTLLGHSQIGTTQIYAEKDHQRAIEVARMIG